MEKRDDYHVQILGYLLFVKNAERLKILYQKTRSAYADGCYVSTEHL